MDDTDQRLTPTVGPFTTAQLYDSLPIPSGSQCIRVLDILKRPLAADERLTGALRVVSLRNSPKFTALSYVRGKGSNKTISCSGCDIKITNSCHEALFSLREKCGDLTIWVDAVCINQDDANEVGHQILLLGEIYTWAEAVYIWLGSGSRAIDKAMRYLRAASQYRLFPAGVPWRDDTGRSSPITLDDDRNRLWWDIFLLGQRSSQDRQQRKNDLGIIQGCDCVSMLELLDQKWLHRSWTFQEAVLASNPILVCGQEHATWLQLYQALTFIQDSASHLRKEHGIPIVARDQRCRDHRQIASSEAFRSWQHLFEVWLSISRPCRWNGHQFRTLPCQAGGSEDSYSVRNHVQQLKPEKIYRSLGSWVRFGAFFSCLLFLATFWISIVVLVEFSYEKPPGTEVPSGYGLSGRGGWIGGLWRWSIILIAWATWACVLMLWIHLSMVQEELDFDKGMRQDSVYGWIRQTESLAQQKHLVGLLQAMRDRESTKPQDRVFAVEGVFQRLGIHQPTPDYNKPTGEIYRDAFVGLMERKTTFVNLLIDCGPGGLPGAPSWVPDWSTVAKRNWLPSSYIYDSIEKGQWLDDQLEVSASGNTLSVKGAFLRTAEFCTQPFHKIELDDLGNPAPQMEENLHHNIQVLSPWIIKITRDVILNQVHESIPIAVLSTFNGSFTPVTKVNFRQRRIFDAFYKIIRRHGVYFEREVETISGITPATHITMQEMAKDKACLDYFIEICNSFAGKRGLFVSSSGVIGSGPVSMAEGDTISIIKGVVVPMILRKQESGGQGYVIQGPAYIHGLMDLTHAEVTSMRLDWETVTLR